VKRTLVVAAAIAALFATVPTAQAAPNPDKELCKNGGFANYVDPTTDLPFADQGTCISFVNNGGTLVPVEAATPVPAATFVEVTTDPQVTWVQAEVALEPFSLHTAEWLVDGVSRGEPTQLQVGEFGILGVSVNVTPGATVQLLVDGQSAGTYMTSLR
jgi:hypothetical protein